MSRAPCLVGQKFSRLLVLGEAEYVGGRPAWRCLCDCGREVIARATHIKTGSTKSCGCIRKGAPHPWKVTHGMSRTKTWKSWSSMRERCTNPNVDSFTHYGGRGITVCERWDSFDNFLADMGKRPAGMTLDRIDPNGNYEPSNCRWATSLEQSRNKRTSRLLTGFGETKTASEWAIDHRRAESITAGAVKSRIMDGWAVEIALTTERIVGRPQWVREAAAMGTFARARVA